MAQLLPLLDVSLPAGTLGVLASASAHLSSAGASSALLPAEALLNAQLHLALDVFVCCFFFSAFERLLLLALAELGCSWSCCWGGAHLFRTNFPKGGSKL